MRLQGQGGRVAPWPPKLASLTPSAGMDALCSWPCLIAIGNRELSPNRPTPFAGAVASCSVVILGIKTLGAVPARAKLRSLCQTTKLVSTSPRNIS